MINESKNHNMEIASKAILWDWFNLFLNTSGLIFILLVIFFTYIYVIQSFLSYYDNVSNVSLSTSSFQSFFSLLNSIYWILCVYVLRYFKRELWCGSKFLFLELLDSSTYNLFICLLFFFLLFNLIDEILD